MKERRKPEYPEKTPGDELKKMPHTKARRLKPQERLEPAQRWQARKADVLTVTPLADLNSNGLSRMLTLADDGLSTKQPVTPTQQSLLSRSSWKKKRHNGAKRQSPKSVQARRKPCDAKTKPCDSF